VEGHTLTVTHADGLPVTPVETDALLIGMGERFDVLIEARSEGVRRMVAVPLGKKDRAVGVLRIGPTAGHRTISPSPPFTMPPRILSYIDLQSPDPPVRTGAPRARRG